MFSPTMVEITGGLHKIRVLEVEGSQGSLEAPEKGANWYPCAMSARISVYYICICFYVYAHTRTCKYVSM